MLRQAYAETYPVRPLLNEIERLTRELAERSASVLIGDQERDRLRAALLTLLPGLALDLRYAEPDDDRDALLSRVRTVEEALSGSPSETKSNPAGSGLEQSPFGCGDGRGDSGLTPAGAGGRRAPGNPIPAQPSAELREISRLRGLASTCLALKPTSGMMRRTLEQISGDPPCS